MDIFEKGDFRTVSVKYRTLKFQAEGESHKSQGEPNVYDIDLIINSIRDVIIVNYLGYDLLNWDKDGFDAKKSKKRIDYSEQLDVLQKMQPADQINLTADYFNSVSDWKKFKGFKAGDVQDAAFRKFIATPVGQAQLDKIRAQSAQNTNAANYLSQF